MIAFELLAGRALGELTGGEADEVDEHVLGCTACAGKLERLVALGEGVRELLHAGRLRFYASIEAVERLQRDGLVRRVYRVSPGQTVECTVDQSDIFNAGILHADLSDVKRLDHIRTGDGRFENVPFDRARGLVCFLQRADTLRQAPSGLFTTRLIAVDETGEREIGRYYFNHTAWVRRP